MDGEKPDLGLLKVLVAVAIAGLILSLIGCGSVQAEEEAPAVLPAQPPAPAATPAPATPATETPESADKASPPIVPGPPRGAEESSTEDLLGPPPPFVINARRTPNHLDVLMGFQGMLQENIDVPSATENWKIRGGSSFWLGYRRDVGESWFSFGGKMGFRSFSLTQDNTTLGTSFHHSISSFFLLPNARVRFPLGASKHQFFVDAAVGAGFHRFSLDEDVPNGTQRPNIQTSFVFNLVTGFLFNVYDGEAKLDIGFDLNFLATQANIAKLYPTGSTAAKQFQNFDLGHVGLDFNLAVRF